MTESQKFNTFRTKLAKFEFTKSPARGRFNMVSARCSNHNYLNGKPEAIAQHFAEILETTLQCMEDNEARQITFVCTWQ